MSEKKQYTLSLVDHDLTLEDGTLKVSFGYDRSSTGW